MNCHSPCALARERARGLNALSTSGSQARSCGMFAFLSSARMYGR